MFVVKLLVVEKIFEEIPDHDLENNIESINTDFF